MSNSRNENFHFICCSKKKIHFILNTYGKNEKKKKKEKEKENTVGKNHHHARKINQ